MALSPSKLQAAISVGFGRKIYSLKPVAIRPMLGGRFLLIEADCYEFFYDSPYFH